MKRNSIAPIAILLGAIGFVTLPVFQTKSTVAVDNKNKDFEAQYPQAHYLVE